MREEIEVLEDHADFPAHLIDLLQIVGEFDASDNYPSFLMLFQAIDAADHGRLAGTGRPGDDDAFALHDRQIDVA